MARFLIVEDEPAVSATFERLLKLEGHDVVLVDSAQAGLAELDREIPQGIILDIRMPDMGGVEFLRRIRANDRVKHVPVGVVTGDYFLKEEVLAEIDTLGGTVHYKPLWLDDIAAMARQLLSRAKA